MTYKRGKMNLKKRETACPEARRFLCCLWGSPFLTVGNDYLIFEVLDFAVVTLHVLTVRRRPIVMSVLMIRHLMMRLLLLLLLRLLLLLLVQLLLCLRLHLLLHLCMCSQMTNTRW